MKIEIRCSGIQLDDALRDHVRGKVDLALGRFESCIQVVRIGLDDLPGLRGGVDKRCLLEVTSALFETRIADARAESVRAAVDSACAIASRSVAHALELVRPLPHGGRPAGGSSC